MEPQLDGARLNLMPHDSNDHARHDALLVVSLAAGDLTGAERDLAAALVAGCAGCAAIHDDVLSIARATAALPAAVRPRDFQVSPEQAARLRPAGWRGLVAAFAGSRLAFSRQLGVGLTTLGLAGLLVSALPTLPSFGSAAGASAAPAAQELMSSENVDTAGGAPSTAPGTVAAPAAAESAAPAASGDAFYGPSDPDATGRNSLGGVQTDDRSTPYADRFTAGPDEAARAGAPITPGSTQAPTSPLLVASVILVIAGLALLIARRLARRMTSA
jgi:hypothetical protein